MDRDPDDTAATRPDDDSAHDDSADAALIRRARERHGTLGAMVAGGMLGLEKMFERPAKEEIPAVWEAAGEPLDIDGKGIDVAVDVSGDPSGDEIRHVHSRPQAARVRRVVKRRRPST